MHRSMLPALTHNNLLLQATCCILQVISRALQVVLIFGLQHWMQQALHQIRKILGALLTPVMMNRHLIIILRQLHWFFLPMEELEWVDMTFFPAPGHLVNSVKDDIYFTSKGTARNILENIYFSSDRSAECCLELFTLNKVKPLTTVSGMVVSCNGNIPINGATVSIVDTVSNKTLFTRVTGTDGKYSLELDEIMPLKAVASAEGYLPNAVHFTKPSVDNIVLNNPTICLFDAPKTSGGTVAVDNIYYDFNSATLRDESFPVLDQLVSMMNENKDMKLEIGAHTDSKGTEAYNLKLSDARAKSVIDYLISKGIAPDRLESKGYGESKPVADNANADGTDNPEGRQKNRRTEFKILK